MGGSHDELLKVTPTGHVRLKGCFGSDRFFFAFHMHAPAVDAPRQVVQVVRTGHSQQLRQPCHRHLRQLGDTFNAFLLQHIQRSTSHAPQHAHWQTVQKCHRLILRYQQQSVRLGV